MGVSSGTTGKVGLMLLALSVGEVGAFVGVEGEAETALEAAEVVAEDVGVLKRRIKSVETGKRLEGRSVPSRGRWFRVQVCADAPDGLWQPRQPGQRRHLRISNQRDSVGHNQPFFVRRLR